MKKRVDFGQSWTSHFHKIEFSESLRDMGDCLLEKASLYNDEDTAVSVHTDAVTALLLAIGLTSQIQSSKFENELVFSENCKCAQRTKGGDFKLLADNSLNGYVPSSIWQSRKLNATERLILEDDGNSQDMLNSTALCLQACPPPYEKSPASPECFCVAPLLVGYRLKSPGFSDFRPYRNEFQEYLSSGLDLYLNQLDIDSFVWQEGPWLKMHLKLFPVFNVHANNSHIFNASEVMRIWRMFTGWNIHDSNTFGPYELLNFTLLDPYKASKS
ncbi:hypothetical protein Ancab_029893 [Ancistrocladus abbreviatus]